MKYTDSGISLSAQNFRSFIRAAVIDDKKLKRDKILFENAVNCWQQKRSTVSH